MGSKRNVDMSSTQTEVKIVETQADSNSEAQAPAAQSSKPKQKSPARSKKYVAARAQVDKTKHYTPLQAVELVQKMSYSKFAGTITAHGVVKETGSVATLTFPHTTGRTVKVGVVDDQLLTEIAAGNIDFDYLITTPQYMPKLAQHARVLGPRGLMPNPKNGTITDKPELKKKELESGKLSLKTERKAPVIHVRLGTTDMDAQALTENLEYLIKTVGLKLKKLSIAATMSPSVKVAI